jgi:hypothetical protein
MNEKDRGSIGSTTVAAKFALALVDAELERIWDPSRLDGITTVPSVAIRDAK